MILGYDIIEVTNFHDSIHIKYCKSCFYELERYLKDQIFDTLDEPFTCDGCKEEIK